MLSLQDDYSRLELAMEAGGLAWWEMELPSGVVFFHDNKALMIGRRPKDFTHYTDFTKLVHKDDLEPAMQAMKDHLSGKKSLYETKYRIKCADGTYKTFFDRGRIVAKEEETTRIAGFVVDMTDAQD